MNEYGLVEKTWREVSQRVGLKAMVPPFLVWWLGPTDIRINPWNRTLDYGPGITENFDPSQLSGIMAHEAGHVALGHIDQDPKSMNMLRQWEDAADAFAKEKGYGAQLASAIRVMQRLEPEPTGGPDDAHRSDEERIRFLLAK